MLIQEFELSDLLGTGSYGQVFKAIHKQTGNICAVKILNSESTQENYEKIMK